MVNGTNTELFLSGEASSSRPKRQRVLSMENDGGTASGNEVERSVTLFELDLLDCPICCNKLTTPIYQCDNGHIACSSCCIKVKHKCPYCSLSIGIYRSRIMEKILEAVFIKCPNAKHGCPEKIPYKKESESAHEKECSFTLCYCPETNCNYTGVYKDLYGHYHANHKTDYSLFKCGQYNDAWVRIHTMKIFDFVVLQESEDGPLVVIQCFKESHGVCVTVNCIAPCAPGVGEFSYHLIYRKGSDIVSFESEEMNKIQEVSSYTPWDKYMLIPYCLLDEGPMLKMKICIRRLGEEV
ncbi:Zinc finger SIAH-type [Arabidopsis suecica]|uniref:RING-type E3 ubiquitin transferase n=1 Tax=Arabidopsis suecica TaxID=45249 RepID=A0A8T2BNP3_ARASU|nr:Zinc finger SIAH-type [Arabidopsis suecica]